MLDGLQNLFDVFGPPIKAFGGDKAGYPLNNYLNVCLQDGRLPVDNNLAENAISLTLSRGLPGFFKINGRVSERLLVNQREI